MTTLLDAVEIPDTLQWVDEYEYSEIGQTVGRSVTGAIVVQEQSKTYGREITLAGGPDGGWITRATLDLLKAIEATGAAAVLSYHDGRTFNVVFNRQAGPPIEAQQVMRFAYPDAETWYTLTLRFLTVE